jgi:hypothetical protein
MSTDEPSADELSAAELAMPFDHPNLLEVPPIYHRLLHMAPEDVGVVGDAQEMILAGSMPISVSTDFVCSPSPGTGPIGMACPSNTSAAGARQRDPLASAPRATCPGPRDAGA